MSFGAIFGAAFDWQPLILSFKVAAAALAVTFFAGTASAHFVARRRFRGKSVLDAVLMLPLVLPPVVTGYALLLLLGRRGAFGAWLENTFGIQLLFTPTAAVIASSIVAFPLMYSSAKAAFSRIDTHLLDAARAMGASRSRVFWTVTFPMSATGLAAGAVLTFARALGEFGATIMVAGNIAGRTATAPTAIYMASEGGDLQTAGVYAIVIAVFNFAFIVGLNWWLREAKNQNFL